MMFCFALLPIVAAYLREPQFPPAAPAPPVPPAPQFPPAPPVPPAPAGGVCGVAGPKRVWYACMGKEFQAPTDDELAAGIVVGNQICCTQEVSFDCLCCMDFSAPLQYNRCGIMDLNAANQPAGSPLSMEDDAAVPYHPQMGQSMQAPGKVVTICTKDQAVGAIAGSESAGPVSLPVECIPRSFTPAELKGLSPDPMGQPLTPGQIVLDERIKFLDQQGMPKEDIPTCVKHYATMGGVCPALTPKAGLPPNSAGAAALSGQYGLAQTDEQAVVQLADTVAHLRGDTKAKRSRARTFADLAAMSKVDVETVLGDKKLIAFSVGTKIVSFHVDEVSDQDGLTLAGEGKKVLVQGQKITLTEGKKSTDVEPETAVITMSHSHRHMGRRAAFLSTSGSFTLSSGGGGDSANKL